MYQRDYSAEERRLKILIGGNIRKARMNCDMSLGEVAKELNWSKSKLSEIENGQKAVDAILILKFSQLFDVSVSFFYTGVNTSLSEELFFDVSRAIAPIKAEMDKAWNINIAKMCAAAFPANNQVTKMLDDGEALIAQLRRVIQLNEQGAWQDIKGGGNLTIKAEQFAISIKNTRQAVNLARRVKNEVKDKSLEKVQMELL